MHQWRRLLVAVCGIGFAVVLMFTETGFENALFDSTVAVLKALRADLILASTANNTLISEERFEKERIYQAEACSGVKGVYPVYIQMFGANWKGPGRKEHPIRVLACNLSEPVFDIPEVAQHQPLLEAPGTALYDTRSKDKYGVPLSREAILAQRGAELGGRSIRLVGTFAMGADFISDGNLILSDRNLARHCPYRVPGRDPLSLVDLAVVELDRDVDPAEVKAQLAQILPPDVRTWTKEEFIAQEIEFWNKSTGIGFIFKLGTWIGFAVGVIICYQIINADVSDHMGEFATLKAMGYRNPYFIGLVFQESVYLSVLSFIPGLLVSLVLYERLADATRLLMMLNVPRVAFVFGLTVVMCVVSGCLAMKKVVVADPAELY